MPHPGLAGPPDQPSDGLSALSGDVVAAWARRACEDLLTAQPEIDDLNVYPVPDGDTGTNLHLTLADAVVAMDEGESGSSPAGLLQDLAAGALLGARGSSGVILSQWLRGLADAARPSAQGDDLTAAGLTRALGRAAAAAYDAVGDPVEGTMLTVARAAGAAATDAVEAPGADVVAVARAAAAAARDALAETPGQLPVLAQAGVVDAGGRGVCVVLDALVGVLTGQPPATAVASHDSGTLSPVAVRQAAVRAGSSPYDGPAYEVMYLLDAQEDRVIHLRARLGGLGDSLVVVGAEPTWNVHVHVDDVGAAIEAGVEAGRPHRIRVTHFRDAAMSRAAALPGEGRGVVAVVAGDGLAALFEAAGAGVVRGGPGARASTAETLAGVRSTGQRDVILLPNDSDSFAVASLVAGQARDEGLRVAVIPTRASVQGIAALAVHQPDRRFEEDVVAMTAAAGGCRHGGVTVARREAMTMAGVCHVGDVLGIVDGDFVLIGDDLATVACEVVDRMLGSGGELVTLVTGEPAGDDADDGDVAGDVLARAVVRHLRTSRPEVDTAVYDGGQAGYPLLIGVE